MTCLITAARIGVRWRLAPSTERVFYSLLTVTLCARTAVIPTLQTGKLSHRVAKRRT